MHDAALPSLFARQQPQQPVLLFLLPSLILLLLLSLILLRLLPCLSQQRSTTGILIDEGRFDGVYEGRFDGVEGRFDGVLRLGLRLEYGDLVLEAVVDPLFLFEIEGCICSPRDLSIRGKVPVGWLLFKFSFYFIQDSRSSFHLRVTFISVRIDEALSALRACFATNILPVMLLGGYYSGLRLLRESDRGFCSICCCCCRGWFSCETTVEEEYTCSTDRCSFQLNVFVFFLRLPDLSPSWACRFLEFRKVFVRTTSSSEV